MIPEKLYYSKDHEWVRDDGDVFTVGITMYAAEQLGDITYVELPETDTDVSQHEEVATVESVKAASDVYSPVGGRIIEVNEALLDHPELVNSSPYEEGWMFRLEEVDSAELGSLMNAAAYQEYLKEL